MHKTVVNDIRVQVAETFLERARGLILRPRPPNGEGLLFENCNAIHTLFMSYPIDVTFLDQGNRVVKTIKRVRPWRFFIWGGLKARKVIECASDS